MKKRALIYGCGNNFIYSARVLFRWYDIAGIADSEEAKWGQVFFGLTVKSMDAYPQESYDVILITPSHYEPIRDRLAGQGVPEERIVPMADALRGIPMEPVDLDDSREPGAEAVAILFYGGLGDFLIGKRWLCAVMNRFGLPAEYIRLYTAEKDARSLRSVMRGVLKETQIAVTDLSSPSLVEESGCAAVLWYNIFPAVVACRWEALSAYGAGFRSYLRALIEYGRERFLSNLFASSEYYRVIREYLCRHPQVKYWDMWDVTGEFGTDGLPDPGFELTEEEAGFPEEAGLVGRPYITLNTGLNAEYGKKPNLRSWDMTSWERLCVLIHQAFPNLTVVQLGIRSDAAPIGADVNLSGRTTVGEVAAVLKQAYLHVDYEGGLVHLRHAAGGGSSVVMYGPTGTELFHYPENLPVRTGACPKPCQWEYKDWFAICHNASAPLVCMRSITPEIVFARVKEYAEEHGYESQGTTEQADGSLL